MAIQNKAFVVELEKLVGSKFKNLRAVLRTKAIAGSNLVDVV